MHNIKIGIKIFWDSRTNSKVLAMLKIFKDGGMLGNYFDDELEDFVKYLGDTPIWLRRYG